MIQIKIKNMQIQFDKASIKGLNFILEKQINVT